MDFWDAFVFEKNVIWRRAPIILHFYFDSLGFLGVCNLNGRNNCDSWGMKLRFKTWGNVNKINNMDEVWGGGDGPAAASSRLGS